MIIRQQTWENAKSGCMELVKNNWEEIALDKDTIPLDVDWDQYEFLESKGCLGVITARESGFLIGYNVFFYGRPIHYKGTLVGTNDVLYLAPEYRKGPTGIKLIRAGEKMCWERGCDMIRMHAKIHNELGYLLELMGYSLSEKIYHKLRPRG